MRCEKAKKQMALLSGNELSGKKANRLARHFEVCSDCRKEYEEFKAALAGLKTIARQEEQDWEESEWKRTIARATDRDMWPQSRPFFAKPKIAWAYGFLILLVLGAGMLIFRNIMKRPSPDLSSESLSPTTLESRRNLKIDETAAARSLQDRLFLAESTSPKSARIKPSAPKLSEEKASQDILSVTLVSQQTGLRVYWTFDRNFDWKEEK